MQVCSDVLHLDGAPEVDELDECGALVGGGHRRQRRQDATALRADILHTWRAAQYMGTNFASWATQRMMGCSIQMSCSWSSHYGERMLSTHLLEGTRSTVNAISGHCRCRDRRRSARIAAKVADSRRLLEMAAHKRSQDGHVRIGTCFRSVCFKE